MNFFATVRISSFIEIHSEVRDDGNEVLIIIIIKKRRTHPLINHFIADKSYKKELVSFSFEGKKKSSEEVEFIFHSSFTRNYKAILTFV